jgi:hypothetical protein
MSDLSRSNAIAFWISNFRHALSDEVSSRVDDAFSIGIVADFEENLRRYLVAFEALTLGKNV